MPLATTAGPQFTADLKPMLALLVEDMRTRLDSDPTRQQAWHQAHHQAVTDNRTAASWTDYVDDQLTQAAVGWLLTSVFVRFCEDNLLLGPTAVWISGPTPTLRQRALDAENHFYRSESSAHQGERSYREWLEEAFQALRTNPGTASLVDDHAAIGIIEPSSYAVEQLLAWWRRTDDDGSLLWHFDDPDLSTRFLGDLYQDLSDYAKKKYALLQTPEFVEEFILDRTMEPALKERELDGFTIIDPTCGSGHFLLGAFHRLVRRWEDKAPGMEPRARVNKALESVHGVDLNPFAVAIAKFRLIVAAMKASGDSSLVNVPAYTLNLAAGDSLLHGPERDAYTIDYGDESVDKDAIAGQFSYSTEDLYELGRLLKPGHYDAVVGNPPYIGIEDSALRARYRERYRSCKGAFVYSVPFMERFFDLAKDGTRPGWVGQITSNSFMRRQFGKSLVTDFFPTVDLRQVIDTSGASLFDVNAHTVIIVGVNRPATGATVDVVAKLADDENRGGTNPESPSWVAISSNWHNIGHEDRYVACFRMPQRSFHAHPWNLASIDVNNLVGEIERNSNSKLYEHIDSAGFSIVTREDAVYEVGLPCLRHAEIDPDQRLEIVAGEAVRDWCIDVDASNVGLWPYEPETLESAMRSPIVRMLWSYRTILKSRVAYGKTQLERGLTWFEYSMFFKERFRVRLSIVFPEVATHNNFAIDAGGRVFKQTAPVIKLPNGADLNDHLALVGVLNSSTVCFWLKQRVHQHPGGEAWEHFYQFNVTNVQEIPLPGAMATDRSSDIYSAIAEIGRLSPASWIPELGAKSIAVRENSQSYHAAVSLAIALQEELDWDVYFHYSITDYSLSVSSKCLPDVRLGERAFEIVLARRVKDGEVATDWFARHGATPVLDIPQRWPEVYREVVQQRIEAIENSPYLRILERPEYKRRWAGDSWETKLQRALRDWLLDRIENPRLWANPQGMPQPRSIGELAGELTRDTEFIEALDMWAGRKDAPVTETLVKLLADQAVPYLAAYRYKDSGLRKRAEWERVWELQRAEDRGEVQATDIPVPPKYSSADFRKPAYWSHRGKLDVPKERFILYPDAGAATDPTPLLGWAGWNHAWQGLALATIYAARTNEGVETAKLIPLVAGIAELLPWVQQWHSGVDPNVGVDLHDYLSAQLSTLSQQVAVPIPDLPTWRPPTTARGRKRN